MNSYGQIVPLNAERTGAATTPNPLEHIYYLERDLAAAERRTVDALDELTSRLDVLETRVSAINGEIDTNSRQLEGEVVRLAERLASLERAHAA